MTHSIWLYAAYVAICLLTPLEANDKPTIKLEKKKLGAMPNSSALADIFFGGQPSKEDLVEAKKKGIKSIINLRTREEMDFDEGEYVKELGIIYFQIPFQGVAGLTDEVFDKTRVILNDKSARPLLFHCLTANRVGAVWLAHRVLDQKVSFEEALKEAKEIGLKTPGFVDKAKDYIERKKK